MKSSVLCLSILLCISACGVLPSDVKDGVYHSPYGEFTVMEPKLPDVNFRGGALSTNQLYVDISSTEGDWTRAGGYSVLWEKRAQPLGDDAAFEAYAKQRLAVLPMEYEESYAKPVQEGPLQVQGHRAWRTVSLGSRQQVPVYWVGTLIDFGDRVGVAMLVIPVKSADYDGPTSAEQTAAWGEYPAFVASLHKSGSQ